MMQESEVAKKAGVGANIDLAGPDPTDAASWCKLGLACTNRGDSQGAIHAFSRSLDMEPENLEAIYCLGLSFLWTQQVDVAVRYLEKAAEMAPTNAAVQCELGVAYARLKNLDLAIAQYQKSILLDPKYANAYCNLGVAFYRMRKLDQACHCYEQALRLQPDFAEARCNMGVARLTMGEWALGWPDYEFRLYVNGKTQQAFSQPLWDGSPLDGRTILLHPEQGIGDTLQFLRYVPLVKMRGGKVLFVASPRLAPLVLSCQGIDEVVDAKGPSPSFDVHAPLLSLPGIFGTLPSNVPNHVPYLFCDTVRSSVWNSVLGGGCKVGIVWHGSTNEKSLSIRNVPLREFEPLFRLSQVKFFSLQKHEGAEQLQQFSGYENVINLGPLMDEAGIAFLDTAAIMKCLDLVISIDSAPAHLAGALGVPVWTVLNFNADWRWLLHRSDTPWYPTMRLFRQPAPGEWRSVFENIANELCLLTS
ncbi:MAG: tetratricopeptide repeat-containing glycosyltransferase family protein [Pirellula sp.]